MTLKISPRKVSAIIKQSLQGKPQCDIAEKEGVNQATVSLWWTRFRERSEQVGLTAAAKEFGVHNEVDELRSLSVELNKANTSVPQAREGAKIIQAFAALGVAPERHTALVKACRHIDQPGFVEAACQLAEICEREGITYEEAPQKLKKAVEEIRSIEAQLEPTQSELGTKRRAIAKANKELASVTEQVAAARRNAQDQEASLKEEVQAAMREAGVKQAEIQEVAQIKKDLAQHGLNMPALVALAGEFKQGSGVNTVRLGQAMAEFDSLHKANDSLRRDNAALTRSNVAFREENANLQAQKNGLLGSLRATGQKTEEENRRLRDLTERRTTVERQHNLFDGFMAMLAGSPSRAQWADCVKSLVAALSEEKWLIPARQEDPKSLFVRTVMGDYLRCHHCRNCDASFIVNTDPHYSSTANYYECPACHSSSFVKADDSFLKAMVSDRQLENVRMAQEIESENRVLRPFKALLEYTCVVCRQPINEWTEQMVRAVMGRTDQAHPQCWSTAAGQLWQMEWLVRKGLL